MMITDFARNCALKLPNIWQLNKFEHLNTYLRIDMTGYKLILLFLFKSS